MRRDAPCAGVDVGNEVCSGVTTDGVLEGASQAQHKSNGTHLLTTHPSLPYPHHPPITSIPSPSTHHFHTLTTHSNPTYPLLPHPITTRATHTYFITHSPSLPYPHHPFIITSHHTPHPHHANYTLTSLYQPLLLC